MRLLLDTHIYLWAVTDNPKLTIAARKIITVRSTVFWWHRHFLSRFAF